MPLTYRPKINDCVVVMRGDKVIGTIRRYAVHKCCIVNVPGLLTAASHPQQASFRTINEAKGMLTKLEAIRVKDIKNTVD